MALVRVGPYANEQAKADDGYLGRDLRGENEEAKIPQRAKVMRHLLDHHPFPANHRLLCFPGTYWRFEEEFLANVENGRAIGVECNLAVARRTLQWMPGTGNRAQTCWDLDTGRVYGWSNERAALLNCWASAFLQIGNLDLKGWASRQRITWRRKLNFTCAWLDFQSGLCDEVARCMFALGSKVHPKVAAPVPVAVTLMLGRDTIPLDGMPGGDPVERRANWLLAASAKNRFRAFRPTDAWAYRSGDVSMMVCLGLLEVPR